MTDDLVNEARLALWSAYCDMKIDLEESADRIEKLEAALREIADGAVADNADDACHVLMKMARKALEGKDD